LDHAVSLVQAYLQLNGYFTAAEFPVVEGVENGGYRTLTDVDILAFRFPTVTTASASAIEGQRIEVAITEPDPALAVPLDRIDMIIAEVKEGRADLNLGVTKPEVLRAVLLRFGCCTEDTEKLIDDMINSGNCIMPSGYQTRLIAFGGVLENGQIPPCRVISLAHVVDYLQKYVRKNWNMLRHVQFKDAAFGFLMTMEKARRGGIGNGRRVSRPVGLQQAGTPGNGKEAAAAPATHVGSTTRRRRRPKKAPVAKVHDS
jgi:hypothetical protein